MARGRRHEGGGFGVIGDIIVGIVGALINGFCSGRCACPWAAACWARSSALIGAIILIFLLRLIGAPKREPLTRQPRCGRAAPPFR
jgi:uncharacterized membrane protein YeaQ/YmgE (transglycosylase-associated protein family)